MSTDSSSDVVGSMAGMVQAATQRLAGQSAACKLWSVVLSAVVLLFASGRTSGELLLLAGLPLLWLALADGSYAFQARRLSELGSRISGHAGPAPADLFRLQAESGGPQALAGVLSFSVWPYYVSLAGLMAGLGFTVLTPPQTRTGPNGPIGPMSPGMAYPQSAPYLAQPGHYPMTQPPNGISTMPTRLPPNNFPNSTTMPRPMPSNGTPQRPPSPMVPTPFPQTVRPVGAPSGTAVPPGTVVPSPPPPSSPPASNGK